VVPRFEMDAHFVDACNLSMHHDVSPMPQKDQREELQKQQQRMDQVLCAVCGVCCMLCDAWGEYACVCVVCGCVWVQLCVCSVT